MNTQTKYIVAIFILGLQTAVRAQSFINEGKQWAIISHLFESENYVTSVFKFSGDSVLNSLIYHKLYESADPNQEDWKFNSLWYENNDSVFRYSPNGNILVYDFNIDVGDTFVTEGILSLKVDSIVSENWGGTSKKHWYLSDSNGHPGQTIWVEGVGQTGFFVRSSEIDIAGAFAELLCFHENGDLIYQNPGFNSCYVKTSVDELINNTKTFINISQPANGKIVINNPCSETGVIVFYSANGWPVKQIRVESSTTQTDLTEPGIFIYTFSNSKGETQVGKIINLP